MKNRNLNNPVVIYIFLDKRLYFMTKSYQENTTEKHNATTRHPSNHPKRQQLPP